VKDKEVYFLCCDQKLERQVHKPLHCGSSQQYRSPNEITILLLVQEASFVCCCLRTPRMQWITLSKQRQLRGCNISFLQWTEPIARSFCEGSPGTTFTSWSKHRFLVIGKVEQQVRKASHFSSKQQ